MKRNKPLPQFKSDDDAIAFYSEYGELEYFGKIDDYYVYNYHVRDGRTLYINIHEDGRVIERNERKPARAKSK